MLPFCKCACVRWRKLFKKSSRPTRRRRNFMGCDCRICKRSFAWGVRFEFALKFSGQVNLDLLLQGPWPRCVRECPFPSIVVLSDYGLPLKNSKATPEIDSCEFQSYWHGSSVMIYLVAWLLQTGIGESARTCSNQISPFSRHANGMPSALKITRNVHGHQWTSIEQASADWLTSCPSAVKCCQHYHSPLRYPLLLTHGLDSALCCVLQAFHLDADDADVCHQLGIMLFQTDTTLRWNKARWTAGFWKLLNGRIAFGRESEQIYNQMLVWMKWCYVGCAFLVASHTSNISDEWFLRKRSQCRGQGSWTAESLLSRALMLKPQAPKIHPHSNHYRMNMDNPSKHRLLYILWGHWTVAIILKFDSCCVDSISFSSNYWSPIGAEYLQ